MAVPHFLVIPFPIPGHVNPLMQFSHLLSKHDCKITFLNTEYSHNKTNNNSKDNLKNEQTINFVTLPDGLEPEDNRSDIKKVIFSIKRNMPDLLPKLIEDVNDLDVENKISCIVVTFNMGWALEVGIKLGIKGVLLWTASATSLACCYSIPKLIDDGIIDSAGIPTKKQEIQLSPNMLKMDTTNLPWGTFDKIIFDHIIQEMQSMELGQWWICNTTFDLEHATLSMSPKFLPIGPFISNDNNNKSSFWQEDTTCIDWLDQHPPQSVIYVSFGSLAVMDQNQFNELALGLDLLNKPFLWTVRLSNENKVTYTYPNEFFGTQGKIVSWAPQKKILNHPAIACFISHCGWNSTIEGVYCGVPFLCWPCHGDQFVNKSYICDVWKVGIELEKDENGLITREEIEKKVEQLLKDQDIKSRSLKLKELTLDNIVESGHSSKNLQNFINWAK